MCSASPRSSPLAREIAGVIGVDKSEKDLGAEEEEEDEEDEEDEEEEEEMKDEEC